MVLWEVRHALKTVLYIIISLFVHLLLILGLILFDQSDLVSLKTKEIIDLTFQDVKTPTLANSMNKIQPVKKSSPSANYNKKHPEPSAAQTSIASDGNADQTKKNLPSAPSDGADSITPTSWASVTRFPKVVKEFKPVYPNEAKVAGVAGAVILNVLIDNKGRVRDVELVSGPGFGLNESAVEALKKFEFLPAQVGSELVPVKIRYTYRFKLEIN